MASVSAQAALGRQQALRFILVLALGKGGSR